MTVTLAQLLDMHKSLLESLQADRISLETFDRINQDVLSKAIVKG